MAENLGPTVFGLRGLATLGAAVVGLFMGKEAVRRLKSLLEKRRDAASIWRLDAKLDAPDRLSRKEAGYRKDVVSQVEYDLTIWVKQGAMYQGEIEIRFRYTLGDFGIFLDFTGGYVQTLWVNGSFFDSSGRPISKGRIQHLDQGHVAWYKHRIYLSREILRRRNRVFVAFTSHYCHDGVGLQQFVDHVDQEEYYYAECAAFEAHRLFPCFDQPSIKAKFRLTIVASPSCSVVANTRALEARKDVLDYTSFDSTRLRSEYSTPPSLLDNLPRGVCVVWTFEKSKPMRVDGLFFAVGPFHFIGQNLAVDPERSIPITIYYRKSADKGFDHHTLFDTVQDGIFGFEDLYGIPFPFEKYDLIHIPLLAPHQQNRACPGVSLVLEDLLYFSRGGTEEEVFRCVFTHFSLICLMWFGNCCSMSWWTDEWLSHALAAFLTCRVLSSSKSQHFLEVLTSRHGKKAVTRFASFPTVEDNILRSRECWMDHLGQMQTSSDCEKQPSFATPGDLKNTPPHSSGRAGGNSCKGTTSRHESATLSSQEINKDEGEAAENSAFSTSQEGSMEWLKEENESATSWLWFHRHFKDWAYVADAKVTSHPVCCDMHGTDGSPVEPSLTVGKGACILKQVSFVVGFGNLCDILHNFVVANYWRCTTVQEFFEYIASTSPGAPLKDGQWIRSWLGRPGVNQVKPVWTTDTSSVASSGDNEQGRIAVFQIHQSAEGRFGTLRSHTLRIDLFYEGASDRQKLRTKSCWVSIAGEITPLPQLVDIPPPLGVLCNAGDEAYVKAQLDEQSLNFISSRIEQIDSALSRQLAWQALWGTVLDRRLSVIRFLQLVLDKTVCENNLLVLCFVFRYVQVALQLFVPDSLFSAVADHVSTIAGRRSRDPSRPTLIRACWAEFWAQTAFDEENIRALLVTMYMGNIQYAQTTRPFTTSMGSLIEEQKSHGHKERGKSCSGSFGSPSDAPGVVPWRLCDNSRCCLSLSGKTCSKNAEVAGSLHFRRDVGWLRLFKASSFKTESSVCTPPLRQNSNRSYSRVCAKWNSSLTEELRWKVIERFWALSPEVASMSEKTSILEDQLSRDQIHTRRLIGVARCQAALPEAQSKAAHWRSFCYADPVDSIGMIAAMSAFYQKHPCQHSMLLPYSKTFFQDIQKVFRDKRGRLALHFWEYLFPFHKPSNYVINCTAKLAEIKDLGCHPKLRRLALGACDTLLQARGCRRFALAECLPEALLESQNISQRDSARQEETLMVHCSRVSHAKLSSELNEYRSAW